MSTCRETWVNNILVVVECVYSIIFLWYEWILLAFSCFALKHDVQNMFASRREMHQYDVEADDADADLALEIMSNNPFVSSSCDVALQDTNANSINDTHCSRFERAEYFEWTRLDFKLSIHWEHTLCWRLSSCSSSSLRFINIALTMCRVQVERFNGSDRKHSSTV